MSKQQYWFKVNFGKWVEEGVFDPEVTFVYVSAWDAEAAIRKATKATDVEEGEVVTSVEFLGYPQV